MEFLHGFLIILNESIKILPKNGKLMAFVALVSVVLSSCSSFLFTYFIESFTKNRLATFLQPSTPDPTSFHIPDPNSFNSADPSSFTPKTGFTPAQIAAPLAHLRQDLALLLAVEIIFLLALSIVSFFSTVSTVLVSAMSYRSKTLSLEDLYSSVWRTWTRPLITGFYVSGLTIGFFTIVLLLASPLLIYFYFTTLLVGFLGLMASVVYFYLFVALPLAIVVSVVEESCGMEALGKAAALVKRKKVHGFLLNLCFNLGVLIVVKAPKMISGNKGLVNQTISGLFGLSICVLAKIFLDTAFTVLYFHCKKDHGEEIELHGVLEYTKVATAQTASDLP